MFLYQPFQYDIMTMAGCSATFLPHIHQSIEILYITEGSCEATVDGKSYTLFKNDFIVVFPYRIHAYKDLSEKVRSLVLFSSPDRLTRFGSDWRDAIPETPVLHDEDKSIYRLLSSIHKALKSDQLFKKEIAKGYNTALFGILLPKLHCKTQKKADLSTTQQLLKYCDNYYTDRLSLDSVSKELGISKYYISHIFNNKLDISFTDYINALRISKAQYLLKETTLSITQISYDVGFSTIRSFNRIFKSISGKTPLEYRKE